MDSSTQTIPRRIDSSPKAFSGLAGQYAGMVYSAARRQVQDPAMADDVTQAVFVLLWQKSPCPGRPDLLPAWLLKATYFVSRRALTMRVRRTLHEQKAAAMQSETASADSESLWADVAPRLDAALGKLCDADRSAIALRYLQNLSFPEVGECLGLSEEAARKRVDRALGRLRKVLGGPSPASLSVAISTHAVLPIPAGLLQSLCSIPSATLSASVVGLAKSAGSAIAWTTGKLVVFALTAIAAIAAVGVVGMVAAELASGPAVPSVAAARSAPAAVTDSVAFYVYGAGLEAPVAADLKALGTVIESKDNYQLVLADAEKVRQLPLREYAAGNVVLPEHATRSSIPAAISRGQSSILNNGYWIGISDRAAKWTLTQRILLTSEKPLSLGNSGELELVGNLRVRNLSVADLQWQGSGREVHDLVFPLTVTIASNQVALALHDLGQVGSSRRFSLLALCTTPATPAESKALSIASEELYLSQGFSRCLQTIRYAASQRRAATQPATPQPSPKWTKKLSDGTTIRLIGMGLPNRWPLLFWDPDGNPIDREGRWPIASPTVTVPQFLYEVISPFPTGAGGERVTLPDGTRRFKMEQSAIYGGASYSYKSSELRRFSVRMGCGPWKSAGVALSGKTLAVDGLSVRIESIEKLALNADVVGFTLLKPTDKAIGFSRVAKSGEPVDAGYTDIACMGGPGDIKLKIDWPNLKCQATVFRNGTDAPDYELLYRDVEIVTFDNFALQPKQLPPVDLQKLAQPRVSPEPTRTATSRPAEIPGLRDDLENMLAEVDSGDAAAVLRYAANGSDRKKALFARVFVCFAQARAAFDLKFNQAPAGQLDEAVKGLLSLPEADYVLNPDGSASSREFHLTKNAEGRWQIDVEKMFPFKENELSSIEPQVQAVERWTLEVQSGRYPDAASALRGFDALREKH